MTVEPELPASEARAAKMALRSAVSHVRSARLLRKGRQYPDAFYHLVQASEELSKAFAFQLVAYGMATFNPAEATSLPFIDPKDLGKRPQAHVKKTKTIFLFGELMLSFLEFREVAQRHRGEALDKDRLIGSVVRTIVKRGGGSLNDIPPELLGAAPKEDGIELEFAAQVLQTFQRFAQARDRATRLFELKKKAQNLDYENGKISGPHEITPEDVRELFSEVEVLLELFGPFIRRKPSPVALDEMRAAARETAQHLENLPGEPRLKKDFGLLLR